MEAIERVVADEAFWKDQEKAQEVLKRRARLISRLDKWKELARRIEDVEVLLELAAEGEDVTRDIKKAFEALVERVSVDETEMLLSGEYDDCHAIVDIHPGAGGTESMDWAGMLLRMYLRWAERRGMKTKILDYQEGEEAGVKSVTFMVEGEYAFGLLHCESGVHRLVRISPFDSAKRRHTSFASVSAVPDLPDDIEVAIDPKDLRVDTYRSQGAGGQHVNVTDSAVRITHMPTGIVVSCQNERSQHRNRDVAMKVLKGKLFERELRKREEEIARTTGEKKGIQWGSQIRSYVMQPYQLVKDHRTKLERGQVQAVLDGDIDAYIMTYLVKAKRGQLDAGAGADEEV